MPTVICSSCSVSFVVKPDIVGKRVKCPSCKAVTEASLLDTLPIQAATNWLALSVTALLAVAIGSAAGFVFGHSQGKAHNAEELAIAKQNSELATKKAINSDTSRVALQEELTKTRLQLDIIVKERDGLQGLMRIAEEEQARKKAASAQVQTTRANPQTILFKDFVNFPDSYQQGCFRFEDVWIDGDFERVEGTSNLSPGISSRDGKKIYGRKSLRFHEGVVFVVSENYGRPLAVKFSSDKKYAVNINCEISKQGKVYNAKIYRIETHNLKGDVLDVYEDKE